MKPNREYNREFQKLYFEEFNEEISMETAYEKFLRLVNLLRVIIRPDSQNKFRFNQDPENDKLK